MGCNCGGGASKGSASSGLTQFRLTYPDGRQQVYLHEQQAAREAERTGATLEVIHV